MTNPDDQTEVAKDALRNSDSQSFQRILTQHRDYLRMVVALRLDERTRARVDPSDVVQETLMEAMRTADGFLSNPAMPIRLWLRKIAVQRLIMAQRKHVDAANRSVLREVNLPQNSSIAIAKQLVAGISTPGAAYQRSEVAAMVRREITRLDEQDREVILLIAFEELSSDEAAQVIGIQPPAIRKRFGRALLRLRQRLLNSGIQGTDHEP